MMIINVILINDGACDGVFRQFWLTVFLLIIGVKSSYFFRYVSEISTLDNWRLLSCIRLINRYKLWYGSTVSGFDILCQQSLKV